MTTTNTTRQAAATLGSITTESKARAARQNGLRGGRPAALTGGRAGFAAACAEAHFESRAHDPCVRYSTTRGFHVESKHVPAERDVVWQEEAVYRLDTLKYIPRVSQYRDVRAEILERLAEDDN